MTESGLTSISAPRRILLVDCDMFYVQVARLEDPEGVGRKALVIVGGSATGRGVVTSASYEARAYGVHSAMPTAHALRLCPDATVVSVPREACSRKSRAIRKTLQDLSPVVQPASIDEYYLDLSGTERLLEAETLEATARRIRERVLEATAISVSVGGGTTKTVAKLATRRAKPGGVFIVPPGGEDAFLRELDLTDLPGVGPALAEALRSKGLVRVADAQRVDRTWLCRWFGEGRGAWLHDRIRGVDPTPVTSDDGRKSVSSERTFARDLASDRELERQLARLVASAAGSLREQGLRARTVTVKLRDGDFTTRQAGHTLPDAVESDRAIFGVARGLLADLRRRRRTGARLLGVGLSGLVESDAPRQLALFEEAAQVESERDRALARVVDDLRGRFGDAAPVSGRTLDRSREVPDGDRG
ncbi:MAG: DNA polymerase IV [Gemmatimonadetes bacterium]|nr:DNA polymerase IV [Gemmatimonadota bacterium]